MTKRIALVLVVLVGCANDEKPVPSCQQAVTHYYGAGCFFYNAQTRLMTPSGEAIAACQGLLVDAPNSCIDDLANWRSCLGDVVGPMASNAECDCSPEFDALLTCE